MLLRSDLCGGLNHLLQVTLLFLLLYDLGWLSFSRINVKQIASQWVLHISISLHTISFLFAYSEFVLTKHIKSEFI